MQGTLSVTSYFTKQKKVWDEMITLRPLPTCKCGESRSTIQTFHEEDQLMQFLARLNDEFEHVRNQILLFDPYPSLNKVFSMILRVEKQKDLQVDTIDLTHSANMGTRYDPRSKKKSVVSKEDKFCVHCQKGGHIKEECFKLVGYPDWFKGNKKKKQQQVYQQANLMHEDFVSHCDVDTGDHRTGSDKQIVEQMIQKEVQKYFKGKGLQEAAHTSEFTAFANEYSGPGF
ncbi:uncharacterized protein [Euphorbia lathyris]|uniref:uncharacterized protein n=1 Tax=Euphorbia lathyris TaxID=212925 RepID=UPI0033138EBF